MTDGTRTLVLLRHGQSEWNLANRFTGWVDVDLSELGEARGRRRRADDARGGLAPDVLHTSLQKRAIRTAELALRELDRSWIPVRRSWRLNERHYGALQGLDKKETAERYGADQVKIWRRAYATPPPPLDDAERAAQAADPRYADLAARPPAGVGVPRRRRRADAAVLVRRHRPRPRARGKPVLVAAHGNSLRALVKHLDGMSDDDDRRAQHPDRHPAGLRARRPSSRLRGRRRYLGDAEAAEAAAAEAVAKQAG